MQKKKAAPNGTAPEDLFPNHTDPLAGWHALAKPARQNRRQKRTWKRGGAK